VCGPLCRAGSGVVGCLRVVVVVATIRWAVDGVEHVDTEGLGWTGQAVYVRLPDPRCRTNAIWLDGADVKRR
jgi:hypothetical protein